MLFLFFTVIMLNVIAYFIPKRISKIEILATSLFASYLQVNTDVILDLKYDLYGYFSKGPDWAAFIYILGIYPAINVIFLNYYPYRIQLNKQAMYILLWSALAMLYEKLFILSGTFYLNGWKHIYSVFTYPVLYIMLMLFHKAITKYVKESKL
ncbi:CBO0543 family protein [Niallia taxi]|uniref:CBO0543 family protein n=2 Tax=Niallia taxi TaxID=2499688 RepID=UPI0015F42FF0|nr:CBO0543 family protein [Niallia taxi]MED4056567.1 hypothetical protein [Niallia taxi]MED4118593.1 hypothetical protein [Niallia taxi]